MEYRTQHPREGRRKGGGGYNNAHVDEIHNFDDGDKV
jgi:hypothetical protein